jgi:ATP-dependent DNA helicase RecQ
MSTGSGKSAIYQIAALLIPGTTIVISPLIALQHDQTEAIAKQNIAEAAVVNSGLSASQFLQSRLEMMRNYPEVQDCRRRFLLNYFGEPRQEACGFCDNCQAGIVVEENLQNQPFAINSVVIHTNFGKGRVLRYEGDKMVILFDKVGYKTFAVELVEGMLKQIDE